MTSCGKVVRRTTPRHAFFRRWRDRALVKEFHDRLRATVRAESGRDAEPSAGVIDSQSVEADAVVGSDSRGFDGGKLVNGRKRHFVVDTPGLLLGVVVTAADTGDRAAARVLLRQVADAHHRLALVWADVGYTGGGPKPPQPTSRAPAVRLPAGE
ncbi:transposase [Streptomyces hokutonensis]|uniref:transposase n=1 Tax=Streptomyces hokutonensis TaxID=1306990 RepID=UPI003824435F